MPQYNDPADAAAAGFQPYVDPAQAAQRGLQWSGSNWIPYVSPEQATSQNLQYTGGVIDAKTVNNDDPITAIRNQREAIGNQLQFTGNRSQQRQLLGSLRVLNDQEHSIHAEAQVRRQMAHDNAMELNRQLSTDRETEIDEQGHALLQGMGKLDSMLRNGRIDKDTYDDSLLALGGQYPLATRHPEAARHFEFAITEADKQNAYNQRRELTQAARLGAKYGIEPQVDPETGRPSIAHTQQAALRTDKGRVEAMGLMNKEMMQKYGVPTGVGSLFNPVQPHSSDDKDTINLPFADPKAEGGVGKLKVPMQLFNQMKADFNDRYFDLNPQGAGVAPTSQQAAPAAQNPRMQLAQRALEDPNASEAHKAAAKRILGIQ